jgi:NADH-quinone oxidoreductase subunit J
MTLFANSMQWILGILLILSSLGVLIARKPLYASLSFLLTLVVLATLYLQLSAQFIAAMQVLVYAGAILVIFVFVIVLFQDAHQQIAKFEPKSTPLLLYFAGSIFVLALIFLLKDLIALPPVVENLPEGYGTVQTLGKLLYLDFFFPFEAVVMLFLVALIGSLYIAKREK